MCGTSERANPAPAILPFRPPPEPDRQLELLKDRVHERLLFLCEEDLITGCWVFTGSWQPKTGCGVIRVGGVQYTVQRVAAWVYLGGFDLADRSVRVRHTCGVPACYNPDHLRVVGPRPAAVARVRRAA